MSKSNEDYMAEQIVKELVGWNIIKALTTSDGQSFGFIVARGTARKTVWVDRDPEGNGSGWLAIDPGDASSGGM